MGNSRYVARFTLQAQGPLMIAGGEDDPLHDNALARDVNGLPMLPASGLAGALRDLAGTAANEWFGFQDGDKAFRSNVTLTDGLFHWSDDKARDGALWDRTLIEVDNLCATCQMAAPVLRDHVALTEQGTAAEHAKFNRVAVPRGARFTFEVETQDKSILDAICGFVAAGLWLGGAVRAGYGEMTCVAVGSDAFDLTNQADWDRYDLFAKADIGLGRTLAMKRPISPNDRGRLWIISGQTEGPLLVGAKGRNDTEDRAPFREAWIKWDGDIGAVVPETDQWVIPATAIKGSLRHRTLFHLRKANVSEAEGVLNTLFGRVTPGQRAHVGKLRFRDVLPCDGKDFKQTHVGLDRFTGGSRKGVLFTDAMLWRPHLRIEVEEIKTLTPAEHGALHAAMTDMKNGLCGVGAEWGEGVGVFHAESTFVAPEPCPAPNAEVTNAS